MSGNIVRVDSASLEQFRKDFANAASSYKENLLRLTNLINEITQGDIQGTLAEDFKAKFEAKRSTFNNIANILDEGEEYLGIKNKKFSSMLSDTKGSFR